MGRLMPWRRTEHVLQERKIDGMDPSIQKFKKVSVFADSEQNQ